MKIIYFTFLEKLTKATDMIKIKREKKPSKNPCEVLSISPYMCPWETSYLIIPERR